MERTSRSLSSATGRRSTRRSLLQDRQIARLDLAVDIPRRAPPPVHREQRLQRNSEEAFVLLKVGADEGPVLVGQFCVTSAVELMFVQPTEGVARVDRTAAG